jgi:hypothetical protein
MASSFPPWPSHGCLGSTGATVGSYRLMWPGRLLCQCAADGLRDIWRQINFIQRVAIAFKKFYGSPIQGKNLKAISRLRDAQQWFCVEAFRHDGQLSDRPLKLVDSKQVGRSKDCETVQSVVPKIALACQSVERFHEWAKLRSGIFLLKGLLHSFN